MDEKSGVLALAEREEADETVDVVVADPLGFKWDSPVG
jgi:hypothetical protein